MLCFLRIGKDRTVEQFSINNTTLPIVTSYPDLGITITSDLSPSSHIDRMFRRLTMGANIIHRCFVSRNADLLVRALIKHVHPLLEYNSVTWSPFTLRSCFTRGHPYKLKKNIVALALLDPTFLLNVS